MKIVHGSDWHGHIRPVPAADLYVFTGDMLENYPKIVTEEVSQPFQPPARHWDIVPSHEVKMQSEWVARFVDKGGFRRFLGNPDAPVVCVRGNHDFIDMVDLFAGCNIIEFVNNELVEILGMRVTGHRGIPWIYGSWNDEVTRDELRDRVSTMPDADVFLTHYPALGLLDLEVQRNGRVIEYGLEGMKEALFNKMSDNSLHCFGHIHGSGGQVKTLGAGSLLGGEGPTTIFSNAATTINIIEM